MQTMPHPQERQKAPDRTRPAIRPGVRLVAHLEAWRPDLSTYAGLVSLSGALLSAEHVSGWRLVGAWLAPTLGWIAAMYGGDYFDRDLDAVSKPHRPIPSGRMTAREALGGMVTCIALGLIIAVALNPLNLVVVAVTTVLGVSYSRYLKARGIWGNLIRGGVTAMAFIMGALAASPTLPLHVLPIALVFWLHDSGSNVVGAICDQDGDRKGGYRTFPVRHGDGPALGLLIAFDVAWVALALAYPITLGQFNLLSYSPFLAGAVAFGLTTVVMLLRAPRPIPRLAALQAHEYLVVGRLVLAAGFIAGARNPWLAVALLVPAAAATLLSSLHMMRRRYEPTRV